MAAPQRRNIELKAIDPDPAGSLEVCRALGAQDEGVLWQRDSYFNVSRGGLKLREQQPGRAHLIQFERAEEPQQRESRYRIVEIDDSQTLLACGSGEDIPAGAHPDRDKQTLERRHCDPAVREPFIAALAQISQTAETA